MIIFQTSSRIYSSCFSAMMDFKGLLSKFVPKHYIRFDVNRSIHSSVLSEFSKRKFFSISPHIRLNWWKNSFSYLTSRRKNTTTALSLEKLTKQHSISSENERFQLLDTNPQNENKRAHSILENLPQYKNSIIKLRTRISANYADKKTVNDVQIKMKTIVKNVQSSRSQLSLLFRILNAICLLNDSEREELKQLSDYDEFIYYLVDNIHSLKDSELLDVISLFFSLPFVVNNTLIRTSLDDVCLQRSETWSADTLLKVFDWFYHLQIVSQMKFCTKVITLLLYKKDSLTCPQLVHLTFCLNLKRKVAPLDMQQLEEKLLEYMPQISVNELGVVCMGYFKTKSPITCEKFLTLIIDKTRKNVSTIDEIVLTAILKSLRKSQNIELVESFHNLLIDLAPYVSDKSIMCIGQLVWLSYNYLIYDEKLLNIISEKLYDNLHNIRLKDLAKITWSLACLNFQPRWKNFYQIVLREVELPEREAEVYKHPDAAVNILVAMIYRSIKAPILINRIMQHSFLKRIKDHGALVWRDLFLVHTSTEIEFPEYDGAKLPHDYFYYIPKSDRNKFQVSLKDHSKWNYQERMLMDVLKNFRKLLGSDSICRPSFILPHFPYPELILHFDDNYCPLPIIEAEFQAVTPSWFVKKPSQHGIWVAVFVGNPHFYVHQSSQLLAPSSLKLRQLRRLGYNVIEVSCREYNWRLGQGEKQAYLKSKLDSVFQKLKFI